MTEVVSARGRCTRHHTRMCSLGTALECVLSHGEGAGEER